jgi:hypothetical protein
VSAKSKHRAGGSSATARLAYEQKNTAKDLERPLKRILFKFGKIIKKLERQRHTDNNWAATSHPLSASMRSTDLDNLNRCICRPGLLQVQRLQHSGMRFAAYLSAQVTEDAEMKSVNCVLILFGYVLFGSLAHAAPWDQILTNDFQTNTIWLFITDSLQVLICLVYGICFPIQHPRPLLNAMGMVSSRAPTSFA